MKLKEKKILKAKLQNDIYLAVNTGSFYPKNTLESILLLQDLDISNIELTLQSDEFSISYSRELYMPNFRELREIVDGGSLNICSIHAPLMTAEHGYSTIIRGEYLKQCIIKCNSLGAKLLVVHPFHMFTSYENALAYLRGEIDDVWKVLLPNMRVLINQAYKLNVMITLENLQNWEDDDLGFFNNPKNMRLLFADMGHSGITSTLDIIHAHMNGSLTGFVRSLADKIVNVHVADYLLPMSRVSPGKGIINWDAVMPLIKRLPNLHQVTIELTRAEPIEVKNAIEFLKNLWNQY